MRSFPVLLAAAMLAGACHRAEPAAEPVRPVLTTVVTPGAPSTRDVYSGELRARYESDIGFRVGGKLLARLADAGTRVRKGQVLARLDPEDARLALQASRAQLASAEADLTLARAELERYRDLLAKKFISASAFDAKQNAFDAAAARVEQARSQAEITSNQSTYTTLAADADGVVVSTAAEPGQVLAAGQPVLRLARDGEKEIVIHAPEGQLARFHVGDPVAISLWVDAARVFAGRIREIAGGADPVTRTYAVRVTALEVPAVAQLGMTANVALRGDGDAHAVVLPLTALAADRADPAVWVVDPATSRVTLRKVAIGEFREDGVVVRSGVEAGERVVIAGAHKLRADQPVRVSAAPAAATASPAVAVR
jgi:membrane fusion protein, multidrug efflux system